MFSFNFKQLKGKIKPQRFHNFFIFSTPQFFPFLVSCSLFSLVISVLHYLHIQQPNLERPVFINFFLLCFIVFYWFRSMTIESRDFTRSIRRGLRIGMMLFITSEIMFFFAFFWAFFHVTLSPPIEFGCIWPPKVIQPLIGNPYNIPLLNTLFLLVSGMYITYTHHFIEHGLIKARAPEADLLLFSRLHLGLFYLNSRFLQAEVNFLITYFRTVFKLSDAQVAKLLGEFNTVLKFKIYSNIEDRNELVSTLQTQVSLNENLAMYGAFFKAFYILQLHYISLIDGRGRDVGYRLFAWLFVNWAWARVPVIATLLCAGFFTIVQGFEYYHSEIYISDGVYGSVFYMLTGFHGLHVLIGSIFIFVCYWLLSSSDGNPVNHFYADGNLVSLECAIWYWHFVDVVWLFLYIFVYVWGSKERIFLTPRFEFYETAFQFDDLPTADKAGSFQDAASIDFLKGIDEKDLVFKDLDALQAGIDAILLKRHVVRETAFQFGDLPTADKAGSFQAEGRIQMAAESILVENNYVKADFAADKQLSFQDAASVNMDIIINLHNYIMFYIILISIFVFWLFINLFYQNLTDNFYSALFSVKDLCYNSRNFVAKIISEVDNFCPFPFKKINMTKEKKLKVGSLDHWWWGRYRSDHWLWGRSWGQNRKK